LSATPRESPGLLRAVSRWQIVSLSVNDVIGSGVYFLPATVALSLGPASPLAVLAAGLCVLLVVLCFAEAGSLFDKPGGAYVYTRAAFGDFIGFEVGWMTWMARISAAASLSVGFSRALVPLWEGFADGWVRNAAITLSLLGLTAINVIGVKHGARTAVVLVLGKVAPLVVLIFVGIFAVDWSRVVPTSMPDSQALGGSALLLLYAYAGFENTAAPAGEFKNPQRDVPFALIVMIASVTAIYTLIQVVALGVVPDLGHAEAPLAAAAGILLGGFGIWLLSIGGCLSTLGTNNNTVLAGSRYLYALAESGRIPSFFARIHPRFRTPWIALLTHTAISLPLALSGTFEGLATLSIIARMATYIGTAAAVPVLRRKLPSTPRTIRLPGGPTIPIAALVVCFAFLLSAKVENLIAGAIALAVGAVIYAAGGARAQRQSSSSE
jgi:APA family basic amino acid/polyamine antiporter